MRNLRSRKWFGTVWEQQDIEYIKSLKTQYILISAEDNTTEGKQHWHAFLQFKSNRTSPHTKDAHWEIPNSITACVEYCRAKGTPTYEVGDLQVHTANKADWEGFVQAAKEKTKEQLIEGPYSKICARFPRFADMVYSVEHKPKVIQGDLKNLWIWGDAGCGKTRWVWENIDQDDLYVKNANKWWDNYKNQKFVLIDDWDPQHYILCHHLKQWADRYPFQGEMKGAGRSMRPEHIIITSNYSIKECFPNKQDVEAIERRFIQIHGKPTGNLYSMLDTGSNTGNTGTEQRGVEGPETQTDEEIRFFEQMMTI